MLNFDLIGRGQSSLNQNLSSELWVKNVKELLKKLNINNFYLFSHSFGGYLASEIMADPSFKVINNLYVAPYNPYIERNTDFRMKIASLYPKEVTKETEVSELKEIYKKIDHKIAETVLIKNEEDYIKSRDLMLDILDDNFYQKTMFKSYHAANTINMIGGDIDNIVPPDSLKKLQELNNNSLIFMDGKHNIVVTKMQEIHDILNSQIK